MKLIANIHSIEEFFNRIKISFDFSGEYNDYVNLYNKIIAIKEKYNCQSTLYTNKSGLIFDNKGNVVGLTNGKTSGNIVFHSHSCNMKEGSNELISLLESNG